MTTSEFEAKTKQLIDELKAICANYGLGNDGNEFKIITQVFLYKFMNDKFAWQAKQIDETLAKADNWQEALKAYSENDYEMLLMHLGADTAQLKPHHFVSHLFGKQNENDFAKTFDDTLRDIAITNNDIFSVKTEGGAKVKLFGQFSEYINDESKRNDFCKAIINKLINFSFERIFDEKYDFFATIFEYLIKDYNNDSGGKYAEYYTPHAVAKIMAAILVDEEVQNVTRYDPSAGSGTLLMNLAHAIGEDKCTIYSQDISQKSSNLLRLNLILNNLVHSIQNIIEGNTILHPYHKQENGSLQNFDYIVSNPPFKLDFSDYRDELDCKENTERFFAGLPNVPKAAKDKMAIYLLFIQHIMHSLTKKGKAAIVVPTGFITAQSGIDKQIRQKLVDSKMLAGVVSMPSNIFATTGTNVSILFIDKQNKEEIVLIDASKLGTTVKEGKNQKTLLSGKEEQRIINAFNSKQAIDDFSVVLSYEDIKSKNYSFSAGQYFEVKIEYTDITHDEFEVKMDSYKTNLNSLFVESKDLESAIQKNLEGVRYE
ncbi:N-6 DNA methylase [Labilibaculum sp. A4]|uniref:HsdM family class I SAM-dependent methyltransferase n=1 Tax=Labilibaculum euxinus TaxID=2686357 RepID=UPI000F626C90|nr:class I SAM-dependent DNA methyltransferase [Labilibaculum euxinus]MDQ1770217.1 class I SAM-dependent DNA methyltransferase [Labilibaculum euxinus]MWN77569.1 N-6 DNA methylase [Labilibaculum euxinus]